MNAKSSGSGDGAGVGDEGDDQEDPSSLSSSQRPTKGDELDDFRAKWKKELESAPVSRNATAPTTPVKEFPESREENEEEKARRLFLKGIENEQKGKLYEAIQFYRRAVQLIPDIEFKIYESTKNQRPSAEPTQHEVDEDAEDRTPGEEEEEEEEFDPSQTDLVSHLQRVMARSYCICQPKQPQMTTHISALPVEIILYILRWVVSSDLDLRSLEMCSQVSRGFYVCSRDSEIWRLACVRVWGINCGGLSSYKTWREMFISRPRLLYNGCYISKTTYIRSGENSFQDQFYRPWHLVQYYRYIRFFPEGLVLMLTTAEEPMSCLSLLKARQARHPAVMIGHYRLCDDRVTLTVQKQETGGPQKYKQRRNNNTQEHTFHLEFEIVPRRSKNHGQLRWRCYSVFTKNRDGHETSSTFEVVGSRFPSLWFSRVKSYTAEADYPLM
ncbi:F-box only protein 9 [Macrosteles quadrilineatus]|uniref:F-box only protein 9 n=1 Tax=Macrosteles quadrilineatus TaxID=74068 RepID=UPI0023E0AAB4|nr:F-box only protein 9 [Macrosteles quadrilineatus]